MAARLDAKLQEMTSARTLQSIVDSLGEHDGRTAVLALGKKDQDRWSFEKLANCARSFANGLAKDGFKRGDTIALFAENRPEWIAAALGIIRSGAVAVPLDVQLGTKTLTHILRDSDARAVITTQRRVGCIEKLDRKEKPKLILLDVSSDDRRSWERFLNNEATELPTISPDDEAVLFYTSGTTGPPKGVPLNHGNIVSQLDTAATVKIITGEDRALLALPLHHVYPFVIGMLAPLALGLPLVLPFSLSGQQLLRALRQGEVTAIVGVPRLYSALYSGIESRVESSGWIARGLFSAFLATSGCVQRWLGTGDMGYFDDSDELHVLGRISTLIKTESGEKVQTEDLEEAYAEESAIREIGVLEKKGKLVALIVPKQAGRGDETKDAVRKAVEAASKRLPSHQRISDYAITPDALPRTRLGKIQRHRLEERYEQVKEGGEKAPSAGPMSADEMSGEDRALLEDSAAQSVWEVLAKRYRDKRLTPDTSPQFDLGIDSLEWLNLTMEIAESSGVELTDEAIARIETVRDLLREVTEGGEGEALDPLKKPDAVLDEKQKRWLEPLGPIAAVTARFLYAVNRVLMRVIFRLRAEGLEHLPEDRQWVITPNHVSYLDPFAIAALLDWNQLRKTYWAGWTGVAFANPVMRFLSRLGKILPVEPIRAARSSLAFGAVILKDKKNLVWFPEGELSGSGELQDFKPGIGMLLEHFPVCVVPVFVHGTREVLPPGKFLPRPHAVRVIFGRPLDSREPKRESHGEKLHEKIANALHNSVSELGRHVS